jgi:hypothetical protein
MGVYQQRRRLELRLRRDLPDDFVVASAPDHPFVLRGPDLIVGGRGRLVAIICPTTQERDRPDRAVARFALCRMALPVHAQFVLAFDVGDDEVARKLDGDLAAVPLRRNTGLAEISRLVSDGRLLRQRPLPEDLQAQFQRRFTETYRVARVLRRHDRFLTTAPQPRPAGQRGPRPYEVTAPSILVGEEVSLMPGFQQQKPIEVPIIEGTALPKDINKLALDGAAETFQVDNGVPYLTGRPVRYALIERLPSARGDPNKYLRAASFSGWALAPLNLGMSGDELTELLSRRTSTT